MTTVPVWQAAAVVGVASGTSDFTTAVSALGTIAAGDLLVVELYALAASATPTWTQVAGPACTAYYTNSTVATASTVWQRVCDGTESGSLTFRRSNTVGAALMVVHRVSGADPAAPLAAAVAGTGTGTTYVHAALTAARDNTLDIQEQSFQSVASGVTWTPPAGVTSRFSGQATGSGIATSVGTRAVNTGAGATQSWTHTTSIATRGLHVLVNAKPDPVVPAGAPLKTIIVGGVKKTVTAVSDIIGGVKKPTTSATVIIGGTKKTIP